MMFDLSIKEEISDYRKEIYDQILTDRKPIKRNSLILLLIHIFYCIKIVSCYL